MDIRRKRLHYLSQHRGTKESDLILGGFADAHLATLDDGQLSVYEEILQWNDQDIINWVYGTAEVPTDKDSAVLQMILTYAREHHAS